MNDDQMKELIDALDYIGSRLAEIAEKIDGIVPPTYIKVETDYKNPIHIIGTVGVER